MDKSKEAYADIFLKGGNKLCWTFKYFLLIPERANEKCEIIIYNHFTGNFTLPRVSKTSFVYKTYGGRRGVFCRQNWSREPVLKFNFYFPEKVVVYNFIVFEMQMREFFHENFAERIVILLNCPKGR